MRQRAKGGGRKKISCESLPANIPWRRSDAANIIGCSEMTIDAMIKRGDLKPVTIKGIKYVMRKDD